MPNTMLAAVRDAVAGSAELSSIDDISSVPADGHANSHTGDPSMSETTGKPAATTAGISQADHDSAVATARSEGHEAGVTEASARLGGVLGADGIKGDGGRMAAALDLALKSPNMAAADVSGYVTANVAATVAADGDTDPAAYETERLQAAGLSAPAPRQKAKSGLTAEIDRKLEKRT